MEQQQQKRHIITLAGNPGSGKSTAAKAVAAILGFSHASGGDLYRAAGLERGMDILQANIANEKTGEIDTLVDAKMKEMNETGDKVIIDSRTAWHFIPNSFKVFLDLDLQTAAERILGTMDEERMQREHIPDDPVLYAAELRKRMETEIRKYKHLYDIEPFDLENYDLVIDTKHFTKEEVVDRIIKAYQVWLKKQSTTLAV